MPRSLKCKMDTLQNISPPKESGRLSRTFQCLKGESELSVPFTLSEPYKYDKSYELQKPGKKIANVQKYEISSTDEIRKHAKFKTHKGITSGYTDTLSQGCQCLRIFNRSSLSDLKDNSRYLRLQQFKDNSKNKYINKKINEYDRRKAVLHFPLKAIKSYDENIKRKTKKFRKHSMSVLSQSFPCIQNLSQISFQQEKRKLKELNYAEVVRKNEKIKDRDSRKFTFGNSFQSKSGKSKLELIAKRRTMSILPKKSAGLSQTNKNSTIYKDEEKEPKTYIFKTKSSYYSTAENSHPSTNKKFKKTRNPKTKVNNLFDSNKNMLPSDYSRYYLATERDDKRLKYHSPSKKRTDSSEESSRKVREDKKTKWYLKIFGLH